MLALAFALVLAQLPASTGPDAAFDHEAMAKSIVEGLAEGHPELVTFHFDARLRGLMSEDKLGALWANLERSLGPFVRVEKSARSSSGAFDTVSITCEMRGSGLDVQLVFNEAGRISGLFFEPKDDIASPMGWTPPPYANTEEITEEQLLFEDPAVVEIILTRPRHAAERIPVLVIGPAPTPPERDQGAGQLRPHKDLALGLATLGVAVLRFEPRGPDGQLATEAALRAIIDHELVDPDRIALAVWGSENLPTDPLLAKRLAAVVWSKAVASAEVESIRAASKKWPVLVFETRVESPPLSLRSSRVQVETYPALDSWLTRVNQTHVHPEVVEDIAGFLFRLPARRVLSWP